MVLLGRIELPTSALPRMRSTTELQQLTISLAAAHISAGQGRAIGGEPRVCQARPVMFRTVALANMPYARQSGGYER